MSEWISVAESLPTQRDHRDETCSIDYLIVDDQGAVDIGFYAIDSGIWFYRDGDPVEDYDITHWMPLPSPPAQ